MKCPHCLQNFHASETTQHIDMDRTGHWYVTTYPCPACQNNSYVLTAEHDDLVKYRAMIYPKGNTRAPIPPEVPAMFADDYKEACLVLTDSPKASAALSRRCLQNILREKAGCKKRDLADAIDEVIGQRSLPTHIADSIDAIRHIGNFAAHPMKSKSSGEILPVEPGEAEWTLDVIEALFDFYFVQPAVLARKREALNQKLADAGKPPLKGSSQSED